MNRTFINQFFNEDCITGARQHLPDNCVDFVLCDPPFGINGALFGSQYNRNSNQITDGYVEVAATEYREFSMLWIRETARVLKPGRLLCVVSGYSQLLAVLQALDVPQHNLLFRQHLIWRYNFGVYARRKFISSHYHILFYEKEALQSTTVALNEQQQQQQQQEETTQSISIMSELLFNNDSVWMINRQNRRNERRNQNQLPDQLVRRLIDAGMPVQCRQLFSTHQSTTLIADFFLGSFSTARTAIALGMNATGFELNREAFNYWNPKVRQLIVEQGREEEEERDDDDDERNMEQQSLLWPIIAAPIAAITSALPILPSTEIQQNIDLVICWPLQLPSLQWFNAVSQSMCNGASFYLVVRAQDVAMALQLLHQQGNLVEINHIIWRFALATPTLLLQQPNHLHILFWTKQGDEHTFNTYAVHAASVKRCRGSSGGGSSANYIDREDVWWQRDVEPPRALMWREVVRKAILYSSNVGDRIASFCNGCNVVRNEAAALGRVYCE